MFIFKAKSFLFFSIRNDFVVYKSIDQVRIISFQKKKVHVICRSKNIKNNGDKKGQRKTFYFIK